MNNRNIEQCIESRYSRKNFVSLAREIIPFDITEPTPIAATAAEEEKVEAFKYLGETKIDSKGMHLLEVKLKDISLERSPSFQRNLVAKYLKSQLSDAALVAFYSDGEPLWKLSLVTVRYKLEDGKVKEELSEAKRFSFIVGENQAVHTASEQIEKIAGKENTYQDILDAFSIEKVTKDFFIKVASAFRSLAGGKEKINGKEKDFGKGLLILPTKDDKIRQEFAIRLINRIIFCWFLKKKKSNKGVPLISDEILSSSAVYSYKNNFNSVQFAAKNYYHDIVEPLFFEMMNKHLDERLKKYRNIEKFNLIPFLNGGLFEPHKEEEGDFYELDKNISLSKHFSKVKVPDKWFKDFFEVLETYNFTVDENTPVDIELSVDPEMLGRIFENLLAEINPETGETTRKSTGSYYTPRTIVEFMVNESLKEYLKGKVNINENKIEKLLSYADEDIPLSEQEREKILNAIDSLKIIDPACGSGAFPMGILQKVLLILQKVDPDNEKWFEKFLAKIQDSLMRETTRRKFKDEDLDYVRKVAILKHSIYGVDIQPMATEISRLRAFLSLIVDAKIDDAKENRGIEPLPNLDFKFVTANSLIGLPEEFISFAEDPTLIEKLLKLKDEYFTCNSSEDKKMIKRKIKTLQEEMFKKAIEWHSGDSSISDESIKLSEWDPFSSKPSRWFAPEWMFGVNGFDIVIANPPYVSFGLRGVGKADDEWVKKLRSIYPNSAEYKLSIYAIFMDKGAQLLQSHGILSYITPDSFLLGRYFSKLRKHILKTCRIIKILMFEKDFWKSGTVGRPVITLLEREPNTDLLKRNMPFYSLYHSLDDFNAGTVRTFSYSQEYFTTTPHNRFRLFFDENEKSLVDKVQVGSKSLSVFVTFASGLIGKKGKNEIISREKKGQGWHPGLLSGSEIKKYIVNYEGNFIRFDTKVLKSGFKDANYFEPKILLRQTGDSLVAAYDDNNLLCLNNLHVGNLKDKKCSLKYILALLNSTLLSYYYRIISLETGRTMAQTDIETIELLPIKVPFSDIQNKIVYLVEQILSLTKDEDYLENSAKQAKVKEYEHQIDQMVYKLYGLTPEEREIIEKNLQKE
jgi:type I restriction-modification system DNA methylase subunit